MKVFEHVGIDHGKNLTRRAKPTRTSKNSSQFLLEPIFATINS